MYVQNKYGPIGLGYSILAAFTLIPSVFLLVVEYLHHHRLWFHYRPDVSARKKATHDSHHMRFLPLSLTNDQQTSHWQSSRCDKGEACLSRNLYHVLMYHSRNTRYSPNQTMDGQIVVGFHQTSHVAAYSIAETGFRPSERGWIGRGVYFEKSLDHTEFKANQFGAYIWAQVDLGRTKRVKIGEPLPPPEYDTVYLAHDRGADEFCVRNLSQILSWIIVIAITIRKLR